MFGGLMVVTVDENGVLTLPNEIVEKFGLHEGDTVHMKALDNGSIEMTFPKKALVDIDLDDKDLFELMKLAHERDITLNRLIENTLRDVMDKSMITAEEFEREFDDILDRVEKGEAFFFTNDVGEEPYAVLMPYTEYEAIKDMR
jgi:AbrB family looped-hinge helix DNA binding protein